MPDTPTKTDIALVPPPQKRPRTAKCEESVKHKFTQTELIEMGRDMARMMAHVESLEDEKERVVADLKARIKEEDGRVTAIRRRLTQEYEYRSVSCEWRMHTPEEGKKTLIRLDTLEEIRVADMDVFERQENLFEHTPLEPEAPLTTTPAEPDTANHPLADAEYAVNSYVVDDVEAVDDGQEPVTNFRRDPTENDSIEDVPKSHRGRPRKR